MRENGETKEAEVAHALTVALKENAEFYRAAAANATEHDLREALRALAEQRAAFVEELAATPAGAANGQLPAIGESAVGGMKRGAMTIKVGLALQPARMDTIVVESSADMERRLADAYRRALRTPELASLR